MQDKNNSFAGILILLMFMVGVPAFLIKTVTQESSPKQRVERTSVQSENKGRSLDSSAILASPVMDSAGVFSSSGKQNLGNFLVDLNNRTGIQIAVLVVNSLDGEDIESFSLRHAELFKLGQKGVDNGALFVASMKDHALRIETGYGAEGALTDAKCAQILRNVVVPAFKAGKYEEGITVAVKTMAKILEGDESMVVETGAEKSRKTQDSIPVPIIIFILIWITMLGSALFSSTRRRRNGIFFVPPMGGGHYHSSSHFGGSGGFGSGSGGFGGGGGSFGGGGASSSW